MPALSPTMTEGNLTKWVKKEGDKVKPGEVIAEIETDKATMEVEAVDEGIIAKLVVPAGTEGVAVNSLIAVLLEEGEDQSSVEAFINQALQEGPKIPVTSKTETVNTDNKSSASSPLSGKVTDATSSFKLSSHRVFASPLAKRIAEMQGITLAGIVGSGPHGRIVKADVLSGAGSNRGRIVRNQEEYRLVPNNNMRKVIAKRLIESKQNVPHFYLSIECNMDNLLEARKDINLNAGTDNSDKKLSVNDFIIMASSRALKEVPEANASWSNEAIMMYNNIDISVAVAIEGGLITPVIRNADQKDIMKISSEMKELAKKAKENKLMPEEYQGGGFSISNLGMYGIKNFSAIINPPQSSILAIGQSSKRTVVIEDKIAMATMMDVTLSCDHRVVDGAVGAKFLTAFKRYIESPILMFVF